LWGTICQHVKREASRFIPSILAACNVGSDVVAGIASGLMLAIQGLAQDHPQRVAGRRTVAGGQYELVAVRVLGSPVVVAEAAQLGAD